MVASNAQKQETKHVPESALFRLPPCTSLASTLVTARGTPARLYCFPHSPEAPTMHTLNVFQTRQPITAHWMRGFSLAEVMVTVGILAVLASLAAPSFTPLIEKWRVQQAVDNMKSTLYYARSEAIKRGGRIGIEKNAQNTDGCTLAKTTQEWGCGWFVFVDIDGNGKWKKGEDILQTIPPPSGIDIMRKPSGANLNLDSYGMTNGANIISFTFSPNRTGISSPATRSACMAAGGRIRVIEDSSCTK